MRSTERGIAGSTTNRTAMGRDSLTANFCGVNHTPFDFTLTFCEVQPLNEHEIRAAEADHVVKAPVRAKIVLPVQFVPTLIAALQENLRIYSEAHAPQVPPVGPGSGPVH